MRHWYTIVLHNNFIWHPILFFSAVVLYMTEDEGKVGHVPAVATTVVAILLLIRQLALSCCRILQTGYLPV